MHRFEAAWVGQNLVGLRLCFKVFRASLQGHFHDRILGRRLAGHHNLALPLEKARHGAARRDRPPVLGQ